MDSTINAVSDVIVVDPNLQDYKQFTEVAAKWKIRTSLLRSGEEALRVYRALFDGLWLINTRIPDMAGVDLLQLIRERDPYASVFLVDDDYEEEGEITSRAAGATAYVCKPPNPIWLTSLRQNLGAEPCSHDCAVKS
ncbi:MAG: response regulator [Pirellulales bacterium]|nr:response regulator [Pirellulales bacterium]